MRHDLAVRDELPPAFGAVSTIGGAFGLLFFLVVQPLGTAARDAMLVPSASPARGLLGEAGSASR